MIPGIIASGANVSSTAFESIASAAGNDTLATITFSNIPQTYKHLHLRILARSNKNNIGSATLLRFKPNGNNFTKAHALIGNGSSVSVNTADPTIYVPTYDVTSDLMAVGILDIHDYSNTTTNKTFRGIMGWTSKTYDDYTTNQRLHLISGFYDSTSAITSLSLSISDGEWPSNSFVALYGIKGA